MAGPGAISSVSGEQMPYDEDEEIISRTITVMPEDTEQDDLEPKATSRTPLKTQYDYPYTGAHGECADWLPDFETLFQKALSFTMSARSPKVLCLAATGALMVVICTICLIGQLSAPASTSSTTTTHTSTVTHTGTTTMTTTGGTTSLRALCGMDRLPRDQAPAVCLDLLVEGIDIEDFAGHPQQKGTFEAGIVNAIAAQGGHGVLPTDVHLMLTKGSSANHILVKAAVISLSGYSVNPVHDALRSSGAELTRKVAANVQGVEAVNVYSSEVVQLGQPDETASGALPFQQASSLWIQLAMCSGGALLGVLFIGAIFICCTHRRSSLDDEEFGSQRNFQRREAEGLEPNPFDGPIDDIDIQEPGQRWSPMAPGTPQEVPEPYQGREPAGAHPEEISPRLKEVQFEQRRAEFEFMHTIRDMGFTEIEARGVLQGCENDHEVALAKLTEMLDSKNI